MTAKILTRAIEEWGRGDYYEAHETLESFVDEIDESDDDWEIGLALCHIAAALHKFTEGVGARSAQGKLENALNALENADDDWYDLDIVVLRDAVGDMINALEADETPHSLPVLQFV